MTDISSVLEELILSSPVRYMPGLTIFNSTIGKLNMTHEAILFQASKPEKSMNFAFSDITKIDKKAGTLDISAHGGRFRFTFLMSGSGGVDAAIGAVSPTAGALGALASETKVSGPTDWLDTIKSAHPQIPTTDTPTSHYFKLGALLSIPLIILVILAVIMLT
jgi:hypothetical protein